MEICLYLGLTSRIVSVKACHRNSHLQRVHAESGWSFGTLESGAKSGYFWVDWLDLHQLSPSTNANQTQTVPDGEGEPAHAVLQRA